jgi:hypothetical protein
VLALLGFSLISPACSFNGAKILYVTSTTLLHHRPRLSHTITVLDSRNQRRVGSYLSLHLPQKLAVNARSASSTRTLAFPTKISIPFETKSKLAWTVSSVL